MATSKYKIGNPLSILKDGTSGYKNSFTAIDDIIDNCCDAGTKVVEIKVNFENDRPNSIEIVDCGRGISEKHNGEFLQPNWSTKTTGKDENKPSSGTVGLFGSAIPHALLYLGNKASITTCTKGSLPQYAEFDVSEITQSGSLKDQDSYFEYYSGQDVCSSSKESHFESIRSCQGRIVKTDDLPDTRLSGTVVKITDFHSVRNEMSYENWFDILKANIQIKYAALMEPVVSPPASSDRSAIKFILIKKIEGRVESSEELTPYYVIPSKSKEDYNRLEKHFRYYRSDISPKKDTLDISNGNFSAKFDLDVCIVDDNQPGNDKTLQHLQKRFKSGLAIYLNGRLINVSQEQMSELIGRHPLFPNGNTGMSRMGDNLLVVISADFNDSTGGDMRNRPYAADLLGLQACKNEGHLANTLLDKIASSKAFNTVMTYIHQANITGVDLPADEKAWLKEWLEAKGNNALDRISEVIFNQPKQLKIVPVLRTGADLLEFDSKNKIIEWNFDSDAHHLGMSKDLSGGKEDIIVLKIIMMLFPYLNNLCKNRFISPINMAKSAGVYLPKNRKRLFDTDYVKEEKTKNAA